MQKALSNNRRRQKIVIKHMKVIKRLFARYKLVAGYIVPRIIQITITFREKFFARHYI
jgi:hypothetical protein